jgi:hypothetical protein
VCLTTFFYTEDLQK